MQCIHHMSDVWQSVRDGSVLVLMNIRRKLQLSQTSFANEKLIFIKPAGALEAHLWKVPKFKCQKMGKEKTTPLPPAFYS